MSLLHLAEAGRAVDLPGGETLTILTGVDLEVDAGEHVAIVGRSGSGKSTLLNLLGLLDVATSGRYLVDGKDAAQMSAAQRCRLRGEWFGFVFQQFNLLARRTAAENVATPLLYARGRSFWRRDRLAREILGEVGLGHRADTVPEKLSGGEQQRVAIARSLVRRPRVVLADEPTGSLDVETGVQVMDLLERVTAGSGAALVTITHDLAVAARADRQFRLVGGRLETIGRHELTGVVADRASARATPAHATPDAVATP